MGKIKNTIDGFKNIIKSLGDPDKDPRTATTFEKGRLINQQVANDLYVYNWIAAKGVDIPIDDATRKWRSLLIADADKKKEVEDKMTEFDVKGKVALASKWARVFGGAVILIILKDQDPAEPMDIENIRPDSLQNFIVLDRYNIHPDGIDRNILSDNFGSPEYYTVVKGGQKIHHSRIIRFDGEISTILEAERNNFWGRSIFTKTWDAIADAGTMTQAIGNLVTEASIDVYKIKDLNSLVAENSDDIVVKRLKLVHQMKSVINGIALDSEDEYDRKTTTFNTLPEIDDRAMQKVSGSFDIPLTRFLGISPSGLNATGQADLMNYYDNVSSIQENYFRPKLDIIDQIIMTSCFSSNEIFEYDFNPLQQLSETEQADVDLKNKDRDLGYVDAGIIRESDVLANLAENGTYITIDENRVEEELANEELELEEYEEEETENSFSNQESEGSGETVSEGTE